MDLWTRLGDIVVLLAASLLIGGLFSRFEQSLLVSYLLADMMLGGPGSIHAVSFEHEIEAICRTWRRAASVQVWASNSH